MGAWGSGSFQNDSALNWVDRFLDNEGMSLIINKLEGIINYAGYIEVDAASAGIAASEIIAAIKGRPSEDFRDELKEFSQNAVINNEIELLAIRAVEKIFSKSELSELWGPSDSEEMKKDLINRIKTI